MKRQVRILFGSQTGTAQEVALRISRDLTRRHIQSSVQSLGDYDRNNLASDAVVVFVCATTGQGEEPDSMKEFWRALLRKSLAADFLSHMKIAVFGLGDSSYEKYNFVGKKLFRRLLQLGAEPILDLGEGDDQHYRGYDGALVSWLQNLMDKMTLFFPLTEGLTMISPETLLPPSFQFKRATSELETLQNLHINVESRTAETATVLTHERISDPEHFQDIRHLTLETSLSYNAADILQIRPKNNAETVQQLLELLNWHTTADLPLVLTHQGKFLPFVLPPEVTARQILQEFVEPFSTPKDRYFFELLMHFTPSKLYKEKLHDIAFSQDEFVEYSYRPRRTCFEILQDFQPVHVPFDYVFDLFPTMQIREFSISSGSFNAGKQVEITYGVVEYKTVLSVPRHGICTEYLKALEPASLLDVSIRRGSLHAAPADAPVICIGPGLGFAPMRSILHDRLNRQDRGENYAFYGCRYRDRDFIYRKELESWASEGKLKLFVAVSREERRQYVQHLMLEQKTLLWTLINEREAVIYLSGNAKNMPDNIRDTLKEIFIDQGGLTPEQAAAYLLELKKRARFIVETW